VGKRLCGYTVAKIHETLDTLIAWLQDLVTYTREEKFSAEDVKVWVEHTDSLFDRVESLVEIADVVCPGIKTNELLRALADVRDRTRSSVQSADPHKITIMTGELTIVRDTQLPRSLRR
jgi:hypothetical protein